MREQLALLRDEDLPPSETTAGRALLDLRDEVGWAEAMKRWCERGQKEMEGAAARRRRDDQPRLG